MSHYSKQELCSLSNTSSLSYLPRPGLPFSLKKFLLCLFLERERGRERAREIETSMRNSLIGCFLHAPYWALSPQSGLVPRIGIKPVTCSQTWNQTCDLLVLGLILNHWATLAGPVFFLYLNTVSNSGSDTFSSFSARTYCGHSNK